MVRVGYEATPVRGGVVDTRTLIYPLYLAWRLRHAVMADYKEQGNHFFSDKKYDQAISCYSKAIVSFVCMRVV